MLLEGQHIGPYSLLRCIGSGAMGQVYLAEDPLIKRQVAIKVIRTEATSGPNSQPSQEVAYSFLREARIIASLDHPHILPLLDYGEATTSARTSAYMVMPFRQEGDLATWLRQRRNAQPLPPHELAHLLKQAASALQYAHEHGIIHQDVKPSNFLVQQRKETGDQLDLLLADFGIAKLMTTMTLSNYPVRGTAAYMAPEQWRGTPLPASDQYALAIMAYQLLTGRLPFKGTHEQLMYAHLMQLPLPPSRLVPQLPPSLDAVLLRALAKQPEERFPSISAFASAFEQAVQGRDQLIATLAISPQEARSGTSRAIQLPGGGNILVAVPPGAYEGQTLAGEAQSDLSSLASAGVALTVRLTIIAPEKDTLEFQPARGARRSAERLSLPHHKAKILLLSFLIILIVGATGLVSLLTWQGKQHSPAPVTPTSSTNPYPPYQGILLVDDPLHDDSHHYYWTEGDECRFFPDGYHVRVTQADFTLSCVAAATNFSNFAYEVQLTILQGSGGLVFRTYAGHNGFYYFGLSQDGSYSLMVFTEGTRTGILTSGTSAAFHTGARQANVIAVVAIGNQMKLYVNRQYLTTVTEGTYHQGPIGVGTYNRSSLAEVVFTRARVWKL